MEHRRCAHPSSTNASFKWVPAMCEFAGGTGDPQWLARDYCNPWKA